MLVERLAWERVLFRMRLPGLHLLLRIALAVVLLWIFHYRPGGLAPIGGLLDPVRGLWHNARTAEHPSSVDLNTLPVHAPVTVERDERGVPHIFAQSDRDAIITLGYVVAQDRLFQMDFMARLAAGRLSEIFGPASLEADRYLRATGMDWAARKIAAAIERDNGIQKDLTSWFAAGANAFINNLTYARLPLEFKLFHYKVEPYTTLNAARLIQYFNYDLSFETDEAGYGELLQRLGEEEYRRLYPRHSPRYKPIIPEPYSQETGLASRDSRALYDSSALALLGRMQHTLQAVGAEGFRPPKGSNNWAVSGSRSLTGQPILAGDMHLSLSLPSIWYEAHLVTPTTNIYGVLAPGTPLLIEAFNDHVAWAFTNSGLDGIDHYLLRLDESRKQYYYDEAWHDLTRVLDTIRVKGASPVIDTLMYTHLGPVVMDSDAAIALRWVAHDENNTLRALWRMQKADGAAALDSALADWYAPAQNVLFADAHGTIGIRVAGMMPIRGYGDGVGLLDGTTSTTAWTGAVPFADMPHSMQPERGYLTSTNQQPTTHDYPFYVGHDWPSAYRSLRIDTLLSGKSRHSVQDLRAYQSDVHVMQFGLFVPLLRDLTGLSDKAEQLRTVLLDWTGEATLDSPGPLALFAYLQALKQLAWDEPAFEDQLLPSEMILYQMLTEGNARWLDVTTTPEVEGTPELLRMTLEEAARHLEETYGSEPEGWRWALHHKVLFRHLTQTPALDALWRGPYAYPGFDETLGPAENLTVTHSASWRVVVDFSHNPPRGQGIYAGGQSGNPFSRFYDLHVPAYVSYEYYELRKPETAGMLPVVTSRLHLLPP